MARNLGSGENAERFRAAHSEVQIAVNSKTIKMFLIICRMFHPPN